MLELPWPPKECSPNFKRRNHWTKYFKHIKKYRSDCFYLGKTWKPENFKITITFYPPDRRHRDDDNIIGSFKSGRDGLADAWGIDDRIIKPVYKFEDPVKHGKVTIECDT